ncbi:hypothetical protein HELRODRAFT_193244 [Helobdella robusta]|uniref:CUE domain-containing protein n=1 Tax=Helobdella robusta TaxID=6412 RepID=T1FUS5_HELRO|nr:hypothetical protein HELRODRAFT_193244 [Helobdella robusta]ESN97566.1 hypothetical protein HELRODRAFT_193244 [Helobdella robusta]
MDQRKSKSSVLANKKSTVAKRNKPVPAFAAASTTVTTAITTTTATTATTTTTSTTTTTTTTTTTVTTATTTEIEVSKSRVKDDNKTEVGHPKQKSCDFKAEHCEDIEFLMYRAPPRDEGRDDLVGEWMEMTSLIEEDLDHILSFSHHKFWSQAIFDESLHACVVTFLRHAPRPYEKQTATFDKFLPRINSLFKLYFLVCLRMSTYKEDKENQIPVDVFGDILYENFIFDVPMIMDMCAIYGKANEALVEKMVQNIFKVQKKYFDDLKVVAETLPKLFKSVYKQCDIEEDDDEDEDCNELKKLPESTAERNTLAMTDEVFQDVVIYLLDISFTLFNFLSIFPPASRVFFQDHLPVKLASFYEKMVPFIFEKLGERKEKMKEEQFRNVDYYFALFRYYFVSVFRSVLYHSTLAKLFESSGETSEHDCGEAVETFLEALTQLLTKRLFLADYSHQFPLSEDRELIEQTNYKVDDLRFKYINDVIVEASETFHNHHRAEQTGESTSLENEPSDRGSMFGKIIFDGDDDKKEEEEDESLLGACGGVSIKQHAKQQPPTPPLTINNTISDDLLLKMTSIQEMLPHLGLGFIKECLQEFQLDVEKTLNALLEDNLPASLACLDRDLQLESGKLHVQATTEVCVGRNDSNEWDAGEHGFDSRFPILSQRRNIYDGDEFDVFNNPNVDRSRIHIGKRKTNDNFSLSDKPTVSDLRPLYSLYGNEFTEGSYYDRSRDDEYEYEGDDDNDDENYKQPTRRQRMYEDEYDDTYDSPEHGELDTDSVDELLSVKSLAKKSQNKLPDDVNDENKGGGDDDDDDDGDDGEHAGTKNTLSLEDPAKLREQAARRRAEKFANKSYNRRNNYSNAFPQQQQQQQPVHHRPPQNEKYQQQKNREENFGDQQRPHKQQPPAANHTSANHTSANHVHGNNDDDVNRHAHPVRDVRGGPKGQGQTEDVLWNRNYKERHKSTRVHHNRKDAAERKHRF